MVLFAHKLRVYALAAAVLLAATGPARSQSGSAAPQTQGESRPDAPGASSPSQETAGQNSNPLPLQPGIAGVGKNHRLILKDGSYQMAREYQIVGGRVRYLSQERGDWEEMPVELVDWDATRKWEKEHADLAQQPTSPAMQEAAEIDQNEWQERNDRNARMPMVAEGLELPDEDGVFVLDTYQGTPELVELTASELAMNARSRRGIGVLNPLATQKANLELEGAHAKVHLHVNDPVLYLSLGVEEESEPVLTRPFTVNTSGAKAVNGKNGAHSPQSGFVIVRVDQRNAVRIVGAIKLSANGAVSQDEDTIPTKVEMLPGKRWLRVTPQQKLTIGEWALVEILAPSDINESVWDFRVDPRLGDNPGSMGPILRGPRE